MSIYIEVTRNDTEGSYVQPLSEIENAVQGELYGCEVGTNIILTVIELTDEEYAQSPEFTGW